MDENERNKPLVEVVEDVKETVNGEVPTENGGNFNGESKDLIQQSEDTKVWLIFFLLPFSNSLICIVDTYYKEIIFVEVESIRY